MIQKHNPLEKSVLKRAKIKEFLLKNEETQDVKLLMQDGFTPFFVNSIRRIPA
jgi:hypothetical protein